MTYGCYDLKDITTPMIRLYCPQRHRFAQFKRATLLERFGPDQPMPSLLRQLKACNIGGGISGPQCQLIYWDAMKAEKRAAAIAKGGLPRGWTGD
jgi:hypothetical protein